MVKIGPFIGLAVFAVALTPAHAQEASADLSAKVLACRELDRDKDRLKCFDAAMVSVFGENVQLEARREERREADFGMPDADDDGRKNELVATIARVESDPQGIMTIIHLDNGQAWQTTSVGSLRRGFKEGIKATIRPGSVGGFRITIEGKNGFRGVKRVR